MTTTIAVAASSATGAQAAGNTAMRQIAGNFDSFPPVPDHPDAEPEPA